MRRGIDVRNRVTVCDHADPRSREVMKPGSPAQGIDYFVILSYWYTHSTYY